VYRVLPPYNPWRGISERPNCAAPPAHREQALGGKHLSLLIYTGDLLLQIGDSVVASRSEPSEGQPSLRFSLSLSFFLFPSSRLFSASCLWLRIQNGTAHSTRCRGRERRLARLQSSPLSSSASRRTSPSATSFPLRRRPPLQSSAEAQELLSTPLGKSYTFPVAHPGPSSSSRADSSPRLLLAPDSLADSPPASQQHHDRPQCSFDFQNGRTQEATFSGRSARLTPEEKTVTGVADRFGKAVKERKGRERRPPAILRV
jgi:hypothetical protein